jgi:hypothetical protein
MQEPAELRRRSVTNYRIQMWSLNGIALDLLELSDLQLDTFQFMNLCHFAVILQCQLFYRIFA